MNLSSLIKMMTGMVLVGAPLWGGQNNSLFLRGEQMNKDRSLRGSKSENMIGSKSTNLIGINDYRNREIISHNITPGIKANWYAVKEPTPKDFQVHDLITIIILESSKHSVKAEADSERESSVSAKLDEWIKLRGLDLKPATFPDGKLSIKASGGRDFEGDSEIKREDTLSARIQAKVIDVLPNGSLMLEAKHTVSVDDETTVITLTGLCRSKDVGLDNSIISSQIADLIIKKTHTGMARDATKRGLLHGILDFLNPF